MTIAEASFIVEAEEKAGEENPWKIDVYRRPILFSSGHVNSAWGYKDDGLIIDADGKVFLYDNRCRGSRYRYRNSDEPITEEHMRHSFAMTKLVKQIDPEQFRQVQQLIQKAAEGSISNRPTGDRDAGITSFAAYLVDKDNGGYTKIDLGSSGDFATTNDSPAANTLKEWLQEIRREVLSSSKRRQ